MTVQPVPGELTRFWVSSESRPGLDHLVDFDWREEKWHHPKSMCGCEAVQAQGKPVCKHMLAVARWINEHYK